VLILFYLLLIIRVTFVQFLAFWVPHVHGWLRSFSLFVVPTTRLHHVGSLPSSVLLVTRLRLFVLWFFCVLRYAFCALNTFALHGCTLRCWLFPVVVLTVHTVYIAFCGFRSFVRLRLYVYTQLLVVYPYHVTRWLHGYQLVVDVTTVGCCILFLVGLRLVTQLVVQRLFRTFTVHIPARSLHTFTRLVTVTYTRVCAGFALTHTHVGWFVTYLRLGFVFTVSLPTVFTLVTFTFCVYTRCDYTLVQLQFDLRSVYRFLRLRFWLFFFLRLVVWFGSFARFGFYTAVYGCTRLVWLVCGWFYTFTHGSVHAFTRFGLRLGWRFPITVPLLPQLLPLRLVGFVGFFRLRVVAVRFTLRLQVCSLVGCYTFTHILRWVGFYVYVHVAHGLVRLRLFTFTCAVYTHHHTVTPDYTVVGFLRLPTVWLHWVRWLRLHGYSSTGLRTVYVQFLRLPGSSPHSSTFTVTVYRLRFTLPVLVVRFLPHWLFGCVWFVGRLVTTHTFGWVGYPHTGLLARLPRSHTVLTHTFTFTFAHHGYWFAFTRGYVYTVGYVTVGLRFWLTLVGLRLRLRLRFCIAHTVAHYYTVHVTWLQLPRLLRIRVCGFTFTRLHTPSTFCVHWLFGYVTHV